MAGDLSVNQEEWDRIMEHRVTVIETKLQDGIAFMKAAAWAVGTLLSILLLTTSGIVHV